MEENFTDINVEISQDVFMECFLSKGDVVVFDWVFVVAKNHLNGNGVFFFPYLMEVFFFFSISFFFSIRYEAHWFPGHLSVCGKLQLCFG